MTINLPAMRRSLLPLLLLLAACSAKKADPPGAKNENTDYLVSLEGIGPIKTGMSQAELEKLLQQKIPLANPMDTVSGSWSDSATVMYKGVEFRMGFVRAYAYAAPDSFHMQMTGMSTRNPLCKTVLGIGIGSTKEEIVNGFDDYRISLGPATILLNDSTWGPDKNLYYIQVKKEREGPQIIFSLRNNKVFSIEVGEYYDDEE